MSLTLASIHIHPVKSLGGFEVKEARLTDRGLEHDRRWMLVDEVGRFISQREVPAMACLHCAPQQGGFRVTDVRDGAQLELPWMLDGTERMRATVWDDPVAVIRASSGISTWLSERLHTALELVYMPDDSARPTDERFAKAFTSLSDGFPYLILSQASLNDLNSRLPVDEVVPMDRFRPNLVIAGGTAFQEDRWQRIEVGGVAFDLVKPCARCVIPNTDQRTSARAKEPLRTLSNFRKRITDDGAVRVEFGMNAVAKAGSTIRTGDPVHIVSDLSRTTFRV